MERKKEERREGSGGGSIPPPFPPEGARSYNTLQQKIGTRRRPVEAVRGKSVLCEEAERKARNLRVSFLRHKKEYSEGKKIFGTVCEEREEKMSF